MTTKQPNSSKIVINDITYYLNEAFYQSDHQFKDDYCDIFLEELIELLKNKNIQNYRECVITFIKNCPKNMNCDECINYKFLMNSLDNLKLNGISREDIKKLKERIATKISMSKVEFNDKDNSTNQTVEEILNDCYIINDRESFKIIVEELIKLFLKKGVTKYKMHVLRHLKKSILDLNKRKTIESSDLIKSLDNLHCGEINKKDINLIKNKIKMRLGILKLLNLLQGKNEIQPLDLQDKNLTLVNEH